MISRTRIFAGLASAFLCISLHAADVPTGTQLAKNQVLNRSIFGAVETLDPHFSIGIPGSQVLRDLFEGLVSYDAHENVVPGIAKSWRVSRDGKTWTFTLRDAKWSDGTPLTAEDFVYSYRRLVDPKAAAKYGWYPASIGIKNADAITHGKMPVSSLGVSAKGKHGLVLTLERPVAYLLPMLTHYSMSPVPRHVIEKYGKQWSNGEHLVVDGAYKLASRRVNVEISLTRNPYYWDNAKTVIQQVNYYPIDAETTALNLYRTGELDLMTTVPVLLYNKLKKEMPDQLKSSPVLATYFLNFQTQHPPFDNVKVRQALSYAIDRKQMAEHVVGQGVVPAYTFTPPTVSGFTPPVPAYQRMSQAQRIQKAQQLLKEAGFTKDHPLEFTFLYNTTEANRDISVALQAMWQSALPVKVTLDNMEWTTYLSNRLAGYYQVTRALWGGDYDDAMTMLDIHTPGNANNSSFYNSKPYNALLAEAQHTMAVKARNKLYDKAELILAEDMPVAPIYWNSNTYLIKQDLRGVNYRNAQGIIYSKDIYRVKTH